MSRSIDFIRKLSMSISVYALASGLAMLGNTILLPNPCERTDTDTLSQDAVLVVASADTSSDSPKTMRDRGSGR